MLPYFEDNKFCGFLKIYEIKFLENQFNTVQEGRKVAICENYYPRNKPAIRYTESKSRFQLKLLAQIIVIKLFFSLFYFPPITNGFS